MIVMSFSTLLFSDVLVYGGETKIDEAVQYLNQTKPFLPSYATEEGLRIVLNYPKGAQGKAEYELYQKQLAAIATLASAQQEGTADALIPYLNYPAKGTLMGSPAHPPTVSFEDVDKTCANWPALSALLTIPGASKALSMYALDSKKPVAYRLMSFCALRYFNDGAEFGRVSERLRKDFADGAPEDKAYVEAIAKRLVVFEGLRLQDSPQN